MSTRDTPAHEEALDLEGDAPAHAMRQGRPRHTPVPAPAAPAAVDGEHVAFLVVPAEMRHYRGREVSVYMELQARGASGGPRAVTISTLERALHFHRTTIYSTLERLIADGWVQRVERPGHLPAWRVLFIRATPVAAASASSPALAG